MFCVIQELVRKKPNPWGANKTLEVDTYTFNGYTKYIYSHGKERFERPVLTTYKISIHESKRVNGVVTKRQQVVTTADYYALAENCLSDFFTWAQLTAIAEKFNTDADSLYALMEAKVLPLQDRITAEFQQSEEYKTKQKHRQIISDYLIAKQKFAQTYGCDSSEYDFCFDVFGTLRNNAYFDKVVNHYKQRRSYQKSQRSNHNQGTQDFNWNNARSYHDLLGGNYTDDEKLLLKKFYRVLSKEYHPDNPGGDHAAMQLINRLKGAWGL